MMKKTIAAIFVSSFFIAGAARLVFRTGTYTAHSKGTAAKRLYSSDRRNYCRLGREQYSNDGL